MANPVVTAIPIDTWVKIATGVVAGAVYPLKSLPSGGDYFQTYRVTTDPAPTNGDLSEAKAVPWEGQDINADSAIDVYIAVSGDIAGSVRVDL